MSPRLKQAHQRADPSRDQEFLEGRERFAPDPNADEGTTTVMTLYRSFVASVISIGVVVTLAGTVPWVVQEPLRGYFFLVIALAS